MILSCRFCSKRFELRDEVLPAEGLRARCPALFFLFYYPMALGITSVFNTIAPILNPALVLKAVGRIPKHRDLMHVQSGPGLNARARGRGGAAGAGIRETSR